MLTFWLSLPEEMRQAIFAAGGALLMYLLGQRGSSTPKELAPFLQLLEEIRKSRQDKKAREELADLVKDV